MRLTKTLNLHIGRKLSGKTKDEILKAIFDRFNLYGVDAVQFGYEILRISFTTVTGYKAAMKMKGVHLFGAWCEIKGGGPPVTIVHVFDYPHEEIDEAVKEVISDFGVVKSVRRQKHIFDVSIYTGTRLVSVVLSATLPRFLSIEGYNCRIWYKGQPLICNLCAVQGHKSADCPNRDRCRKCGEKGHFAKRCRNPQNDTTDGDPPAATDNAGSSTSDNNPPERTNGDEMNVDLDGNVGEVNDGQGNPPPAAGGAGDDGENGVEMIIADGTVGVASGGSNPPGSNVVNDGVDCHDQSHQSEGVNASVNGAHSLDASQTVIPSNTSGKLFDEAGSDVDLSMQVENSNVKESALTDVDEDDFEDASDDAGVEIGAFSSPPPSSSPVIDSFSDESQSILTNVVPRCDVVPGGDRSTSEQIEEEDSLPYNGDDESGMDESGPSLKRKTCSEDATSVSLRAIKPGSNKVKITKAGSAVHTGLPRVASDRPSRS